MLMLADLQKAQESFYGAGALFFFLGSVVVAAAAFGGVLAMTLVVTPNVTQRCSDALKSRNILSFFAGLPFLGLFVVFGVVGKKLPAVGAVGVLVLGLFALVGLAAASEDIGRRLFWACGREGSRASHLLAGWGVFFLAACVPFVGWFVVLPYVVLSGLGSMLVAAFRGEPKPAQRW